MSAGPVDPPKRRGTATSAFGVGRREGHDASAFYERFHAPELTTDQTVNPPSELDVIVHGDARDMSRVASNSVALVVTSPPYFAGKAYETELGEGHVPADYMAYLEMLRDVFAECARALQPGGRIAVNVANLGRRPFRSLAGDVTAILQDDLRLLLRGEIVWIKQRGAAGNCAWGSFQRPGNPVLRDLSERVVLASKGRFDRALDAKTRAKRDLPSVSTMTRDEFMEATTDVWEIPAESATRIGHPAPFPVALPERLIHMHTYEGELVLDPFMGAGSTAVAALRTRRHYVGYDTDAAYIELANERIARNAAHTRHPTARLRAGDGRITAPLEGGWSSAELAAHVVTAAGFTGVESKPALAPGVDLGLRATAPDGTEWWFEVAGGRTVSRPGLQRADVLWRALGKATVVAALRPQARYAVLTCALPAATSGAKALEAASGPGRSIAAVIDITAPNAAARLRATS